LYLEEIAWLNNHISQSNVVHKTFMYTHFIVQLRFYFYQK
jgi:hypothetical protein